nr:cellulose binding domain-containing protein [uncultured Dyadobacter sp.]
MKPLILEKALYVPVLIILIQSYCFAQTFTPSPDVLAQALSANLVRWQPDPEAGQEQIAYNALATGKAMNYLALVAYHNPNNTTVINRLLAHIRNAIAGGNEPVCRGGISGWSNNSLAQTLTLAKNTEAVWTQLTSDEINKCDWLMRALTVVGNYNQNFYNDPVRCLLGVNPFGGKRNAPNIQEGYVGIMITSHKYFGGAAAVNQILADFDYDSYLSTFENLGFTNIVFGWTYAYGNTPAGRAQMKSLMEQGGTDKGGGTINSQGVRRPFTFNNFYTLAEIPYDPFLIYQATTERMFRPVTHNVSTSGEAYVLSNRTSPMTGLTGMCGELQFTDGFGERSSVRYAYDGWSNSILTFTTLKALGLWGNTAAHQDIYRRMKVGSIDLLYKYKAGYRGRSNGEFFDQTEFNGIDYGYVFLKDIWNNYLWDRPDPTMYELMAPTVTESFAGVTLGSEFSDGQFTGQGGLVWNYTQARHEAGSVVKPADENAIVLASHGNGTFNTTLAQPVKGFRFKVRNLSGNGSPTVTVSLNGTVLRTYTSFGTDETEVVNMAGLSALAGDQLSVSNSGSVELSFDDLELEQVSIPAAPTNLTISNVQMSELTLTWTDNSTTETGYQLERRELPAGTFQTVQGNLPVNTATYLDNSVLAETNYEYRLKAINLAGSSAAALVETETLPLVAQDMQVAPILADAFVNAGAANAGSNYGTRTNLLVKFAGPNNTTTRESFLKFDLSGINKQIQRATLRLFGTSIEANVLNPSTLRLDVIEQDNWGETTINWTNSRSFTSLGEVLTWDPVNGVNNVDLATSLLQDQAGGLLTLKILTTENLLANLASKEATSSGQRPQLTIHTDHITAPTELTLSGNGQPQLKWTDNSSNESEFIIQRKSAGGTFANLASVGVNVDSYIDTSAAPGIAYTYRVYALDNIGKSAYSNQVELTTPTLQVWLKDGDAGQITNNQIKPDLLLKNFGNIPVPYHELTVRYWFTSENHATINSWIDWAQLGTNLVKLQYVRLAEPRRGADGYLEYTFEPAVGQLIVEGTSGPIQSRIAKQTWTNFNETDDHSYADHADYALTQHVTLYRNGQLLSGVEPVLVSPVKQALIESENKNNTSNSNSISTYLRIQNTGNVPLEYKDITVRYWFTADGSQPLNHWIDYAALGSSRINGQFVTLPATLPGADTYLEFSFDPTLGSLEPLASTGNIQFRIAKGNWSAFDEADDHSYKVSAPMGVNNKITLYHKGELIYGTEPIASGARVAAFEMEDDAEAVTKAWSVYPNPARDEIRLDGGDSGRQIDVSIIGINGQSVHQEKTYLKSPIRVEQLSSGIYLLRVVQDGAVRHMKLLKQ